MRNMPKNTNPPTYDVLHTLAAKDIRDVVDRHRRALDGSRKLVNFISPLHSSQADTVCNGRINGMFNRVIEHNMNDIIKVLSGAQKTATLHGMTVHKDGRISIQARWLHEKNLPKGGRLIWQRAQAKGYAGWSITGKQTITQATLIPDPNMGIGAYLTSSNIYVEACGTDADKLPEWFTQMKRDISAFGQYAKHTPKNNSPQDTKKETLKMKTQTQTTDLNRMTKAQLLDEASLFGITLNMSMTKKKMLDTINRVLDRAAARLGVTVEEPIDPRIAELEDLRAQVAALEQDLGITTEAKATSKATPKKTKKNARVVSKEDFKAMKVREGGWIKDGLSLKEAIEQGYLNADGSRGPNSATKSA